ncbi:MAG: putative Glutathionylspermidine synthase [Rhodospirillaceae bacterium]|nr:MAG: putative Glutathionylspermidine synthase [Rhodospirillaceae bacterium]
MKRIPTVPRTDWRKDVSVYPYGLNAAAAAEGWDESVYYEFSAEEIDRIESTANETHEMIQETVRRAIEGYLLPLMGFAPETARRITSAWKALHAASDSSTGLFGRLDFAYDGHDSLKLVGACYDGPGGLFAASIVQWNWLEVCFPEADQFNGLHEGLVERWEKMAVGRRDRWGVHLSTATPDAVREGELAYLAATAEAAGLKTTTLAIQDIGWDGAHFVDLENHPIAWLLKLYPWEAMIAEQFGEHLARAGIPVLDPLGWMPASNHALLAMLWETYPEHPNLCQASLSEIPETSDILRRSLFGLERPAERLTREGRVVADTGPVRHAGGHVSLAWPPLFRQNDGGAILNAWMVGDSCLGMTVRESRTPVGWSDAAIVPHLFKESCPSLD